MYFPFRLLSISVIFSLICLSFQFPDAWELAKDKDGIQVYTQKIAGNPLKAYKSVMEVESSLDHAVSTFQNVSLHPKWVYNYKESRIVKRNSEKDYYLYFHIHSPWPVADRDMIVRLQFKQVGKSIVCIQSNAPDLLPIQDGRIRIPVMEANWRFTPQSNGKVEIMQEVKTAPGGAIPKWLANIAVVDAPFQSFSDLKKILEK